MQGGALALGVAKTPVCQINTLSLELLTGVGHVGLVG